MNVVLINGSPHPRGCTYTALTEAAGRLNAAGIETTLVQVGNKAVRGCIACNKCVETGQCVFTDDPVNECIGLLRRADGLIAYLLRGSQRDAVRPARSRLLHEVRALCLQTGGGGGDLPSRRGQRQL